MTTETNEILKSLKSEELVKCLELLRLPILKLSDINISKTNFNKWKKEKYLDSMFGEVTTNKVWQKFSLIQLMVLTIVNMLWERRMTTHIKSYVDALMDDKELNDTLNEIIEDEEQLFIKAIDKARNSDMLSYLVKQKIANPNLPPISLIEAITVASIKLQRQYSLMIFDNGEIDFYSTSILSDYVGYKIDINLLNNTFLNIAFSSLVTNILKDNRSEKTNTYLTEQNNLIDLYIKQGYDLDSLSDIFNGEKNIETTQEQVYDRAKNPTIVPNISALLNEYENQNVLIKVRDGKKQSIRRLIMNKLKGK